MAETPTARYQFIAHALHGSGPFRPSAVYDSTRKYYEVGDTALVRYPRESDQKFAARNKLAAYKNPLQSACARFAGYLTRHSPLRELPHPLYEVMADDIDGRGNALDVFFSGFSIEAKARGAMLLLVDMPPALPATLGDQIAQRVVPTWTAIAPERLKAWQIGDDGKFDQCSFSGRYQLQDGEYTDCTWHFDRAGWQVEVEDKIVDAADHPLGECPVLIFSETGEFPGFGPFAQIADLARDLFNQYSELREIHRSQNFSLLTMQVSDNTTDQQKLEAAKVVGETIGTNNLMVHTGATPAFIAPADGPAQNYLDSIKLLTDWINEIGLNVEMPDQQESGIALQMRFQALNSALSSFAERMEDFERRAWELSRRWLALEASVDVQWQRDFSLSDVNTELQILTAMQMAAMPDEAIAEQQKRIIALQFAGLDEDAQAALFAAIDEGAQERATQGEAA